MFTGWWALVTAQLWKLPSERRVAWTVDWAPKHGAVEMPRSTALIASSSERPWDFCLLGREGTHWRQSHYYFPKGPKDKFSACRPSTWTQVKEGQWRLVLPEESLVWEALGRDVGEPSCWVSFDWTYLNTAAAIFVLEEQATPRRETITWPYRKPPSPAFGILLALPCIFIVWFFSYFSPPCILNSAEETAT